MLPPFAELKVGPFVNVPLFPYPDLSNQVVDPDWYDLVLAASSDSTNPSVTVCGPVNIFYKLNLDLVAL